MSTPDGGRIRRRIAEIDQHIAVLNKERDELIFAERVLDRLSGNGGEGAPTVAPTPKSAKSEPAGEPDSIEEALSKLESAQFKS